MDTEDIKFLNLEYYSNFITDVIFRIDYSPILKISDNIPIALQDKIRGFLPEFKENKIYGLKVTNIGKDKVLNKEEEIRPEWQFTDKEKTKITNLSQDSLNIIIKKYKNFRDYKDFIMKIVNFFYEEYKPIEVKRLGLRYINNININGGNPLEWEKFINAKLIYHLKGFFKDSTKISRAMGQLCLNMDNFNIIFNYGIFNPEYPLKVAKKEFILDYDCYLNECDFEEIEKYLINFNKEIKSIFENSIKHKLREKMGIVNE